MIAEIDTNAEAECGAGGADVPSTSDNRFHSVSHLDELERGIVIGKWGFAAMAERLLTKI